MFNYTTMKRAVYISIIMVCMVSLLPFLLLCKYVHAVNDDYVYALRGLSSSAFQATVDTYMDWSGRFFATCLSNLNPLIYRDCSALLVKIYPFALILIFCVSIYFLFRMLFHNYLKNIQILSMASLFVVLFVVQVPRISEFFYWFSSYIAYTIPCVMTALLFAFIAKRNAFFILLQALFIICIIGCNEVVAVLLTCTIAYWTYVNYNNRKKQSVFLLIVAVLSLLIVIASPGNFHRMSGQLSTHPYIWALGVSLLQTVSWTVIWIPTLILMSIIYVPLFGIRIASMKIFDQSLKKYLCFVVAAVFLAHIPPTLGLSSVMIGRTASNLYFFYIFFYFFGLQILLHKYEYCIMRICTCRCTDWAVSVMLFAIVFVSVFQIDTSVTTAYVDLFSGKAVEYDRILTNREVMTVKGVKCNEIVRLHPLEIVPKTLYVNDMGDNAKDVFNIAYKNYYGLKKGVVVDKSNIHFVGNYESLFLIGKQIRQ